jgi:phosphatidylinositol-3-phosphatase
MLRAAMLRLSSLAAVALLIAGCSDDGSTPSTATAPASPASPVSPVSPTPSATAPVITTQPANVTVTDGQPANFAVVASGTAPLSYQWRKNGSAIAGATAATYSITASTAGDSGSVFSVTVGNAAGSVTSSKAVLTVDARAGVSFGHVVIVMEENANYSNVVEDASTMPYLHSLVTGYGVATQYYANTHPSIGNYMMLTTGQILTNDDSETPESFPVSADNIVRELSANGKTWKAYAEDLPSVGYIGGNTGNYAVRHVPLAYLTDVQDSATTRQGLVPFTQFAKDLASGSLPNFSFVTPNLCDDAHNCALSVADDWLKTNIAPLLTSTPFKNDGLLIVTFDESQNDDTHGGGRVAAVFISPAFSKKGYQSTTLYQHQSTLRLMLQGLGITSFPGAAATAPAMTEFFSSPSTPSPSTP